MTLFFIAIVDSVLTALCLETAVFSSTIISFFLGGKGLSDGPDWKPNMWADQQQRLSAR
jgi:hypothetical protein